LLLNFNKNHLDVNVAPCFIFLEDHLVEPHGGVYLKTLEKPIKCINPKIFPGTCVFRSPLMLPAHIKGPDRGTQIYGGQIIPNPPDHSYFHRGGGSKINDRNRAHLDGSGSSAQIYGQHWIPDPPIHSSFNGGGGSGMNDNKHAYICGLEAGG
jgi:hypothetical protein